MNFLNGSCVRGVSQCVTLPYKVCTIAFAGSFSTVAALEFTRWPFFPDVFRFFYHGPFVLTLYVTEEALLAYFVSFHHDYWYIKDVWPALLKTLAAVTLAICLYIEMSNTIAFIGTMISIMVMSKATGLLKRISEYPSLCTNPQSHGLASTPTGSPQLYGSLGHELSTSTPAERKYLVTVELDCYNKFKALASMLAFCMAAFSALSFTSNPGDDNPVAEVLTFLNTTYPTFVSLIVWMVAVMANSLFYIHEKCTEALEQAMKSRDSNSTRLWQHIDLNGKKTNVEEMIEQAA